MSALGDTAEYFETEIKSITDDEDEPEIEKVVVGQYLLEEILGNVNSAVIISPITEDSDLIVSDGETIKAVGINVPWHITLGVVGGDTEASKEILRLTPLVQAEIAKDLTQGGTCTESTWGHPRAVYDAGISKDIGAISAGRIIVITTYSD